MNTVLRTFRLSLLTSLATLVPMATASAQCTAAELDEFHAFDAFAGDQFGRSVAIDDFVAVVGSPEDEFGRGAAYVYAWDGINWRYQGKLTASTGAAGHKFGTSVAISGDTIVVGAYKPGAGLGGGSAYVFEKPLAAWADMTETATLSGSDTIDFDNFGYAVDIDGTTIAVGAYLDDDGGTNSGTAFVFEAPIGGWVNATETGKLTAADTNQEDQFGVSISISGDTIAVGADRDSDVLLQAGSAYVFVKPAMGWATMTHTAKLTASTPVDFDRFGLSIGVSGQTVVVGAWGDDQVASKSGAAYVFNRPLGGWGNMSQTAKLTSSVGAAGDHLGWAVDIDGGVIVAGAPANLFDGSGFGYALLYLEPVSGWANSTENSILEQPNPVNDDEFGVSVSIGSPIAHIGARFYETGGFSNSGAAYIYAGAEDCNGNAMLDLCEMILDDTLDSDEDGKLDNCSPIGTEFCNGDGGNQMGCTNCPCGNNTIPGTVGGCLNSAGTAARLSSTGSTSVSLPSGDTSDLRFGITGVPTNAFCILNSGDSVAPGNMANPCFGLNSGAQAAAFDGLRCAIQNTRRHGGRSADVNGDVGITNSPWGGEGGPPVGLAVAGGGFVAGQTRYFQVINRDDPLTVCMRGLNTSQAIEITFTP